MNYEKIYGLFIKIKITKFNEVKKKYSIKILKLMCIKKNRHGDQKSRHGDQKSRHGVQKSRHGVQGVLLVVSLRRYSILTITYISCNTSVRTHKEIEY